MRKKAVKYLVTLLLVFLFSTVYCQTGFSDYTPMDPSGLPSFGEELVISNDTLIIIDEGETAVLAGNLTVLGTSDNVTNVQIIVNGTLIVNGKITGNRANFTLQNNGMLSMDNAGIINTGNSSIYLFNDEIWTINATSLSTYAGSTYISNNGAITAQEWKLLDQYDGTYIDNSGEGTFENCTITARVSDTAASVVSDDSGNVLVTVVWDSPLTAGLYDIIVDVNGNGHYDEGIDALDDNDVEVTAGFAVPEYPALSALLLFMTATLMIGIVHKKRNVKS